MEGEINNKHSYLYTNSLQVISLLPTSKRETAPKRPRMLIIPITIHFSLSPPSRGLPLPPPVPDLALGPKAPNEKGLIFCLAPEGAFPAGGACLLSADLACLASAAFGASFAPPGLKNFSKPFGGFSAKSRHCWPNRSRNATFEPFFNIDRVRHNLKNEEERKKKKFHVCLNQNSKRSHVKLNHNQFFFHVPVASSKTRLSKIAVDRIILYHPRVFEKAIERFARFEIFRVFRT